jgi:outer membrane cobalamin receptor
LSYTLDGVPARYLLHTLKFVEDGASVTMVNGDVLDHASLLRGAYPQRFDPRRGAALEFTSSDGSRERTRYNLTASGTSASATADGPLGSSGRGSWLATVRQSYLDLFIKQVLDDSSLAFGFTDLLAKMVYDVSTRDQIEVAALLGRSRFDEQEPARPSSLDIADHAGGAGSLAWRHTRSSATAVNRLTSRLFFTGETFENRNAADEQVAEGRATDFGLRMDFSAAVANRLFEAGASFERLDARQKLAFRVPGYHVIGGEDFTAATHEVGLYGQARWAFGPARLTMGTRVDHFGLTDDWVASPWLLADWQAGARLRLRLGAGLHHQFPEIAQVVGRRGDPGLDPEQAVHVDGGLEGRLKDNLRWQVTVYDREERGVLDLPDQYPRLVDGVLQPRSATSLYANRLTGSSRGVELMLQRKSPGGLSGWVAYSFGHTRYTDRVTGERFDGDFDQRHTISVFARYRLSDRMSVNGRWRYGSNRPFTGYIETRPDGRSFVGPDRNATRVPAFSRLDIRADRTYRWGRRRLTLFAEVANVLDRENVAQVPPEVDPRTGQVFDMFRSTFPIVPSLGASLEF